MPTIVQNAKMTITAGFGSAGEDLTLGAALLNSQTFEAGGVPDGALILYCILTGSDIESGQVTYHHTGPTLTGRNPSVSTNNNAPITVNASSYVMATAIVDGSSNPFSAELMKANLDFDATIHGLRIRGDLSSSVSVNRFGIQSSIQNGMSILPIFPNGSSRASGFLAESTVAGTSTALEVGVSGDEAVIVNYTRGGVAAPINVYRDSTLLASLDDASGNARFYNTLRAITPSFGDISDKVATTQYVQSAIGGVTGMQSTVTALQASVAGLQSTSAHNGANSDITSLAGLTGSITTTGAIGLVQSVDAASTAFPWNVATTEGPIYQYVSKDSAGVFKSDDTTAYQTAWSFNFQTGVLHTDALTITCTLGSLQTSGPGVGLVSTGLWGDSTNTAIRAQSSGGSIAFQSPSGSSTWGWIQYSEMALVSDASATLTIHGNSVAGDNYYIKQIVSDMDGSWTFRQVRPSDNLTVNTYLDQSGGSLLTSMNASAIMSGLFAPTNSPTFTGAPLVPTPSLGSSDGKIVNTAYVASTLASYLTALGASSTYMPLAGGSFAGPVVLSGDPTLPLHPTTKQYVDAAVSLTVSDIPGAAPLASPFFTGIVGVIGTANESLRGFVSYQYSNDENGSRFVGAKARGVLNSPLPVLSGDGIAMLSAVGWGAGDENWSSSVGYLEFSAAEDWGDLTNGTRARIGVTPIGSAFPVDALFIESNGYVGIGASPSYPLDVSGDIRTTGYFRGNGSLITGLTRSQVSGAAASGANADIVGLTSGNIVIGPGTAQVLLDVNGNVAGSLTTVAPTVAIRLNGADGQAAAIFGQAYSASAQFLMRRAGGTGAAPTSVSNEDILGNVSWFGHIGGGIQNNYQAAASIKGIAAENFSSGHAGAYLQIKVNPVGSVTASEIVRIYSDKVGIGGIIPAYQLDVSGDVHTAGYFRGNGSQLTGITASQVSGVVTSVGLSVPGVIFSVSGTPITSSGTISFGLLNQSANAIFGGPSSGVPAAPSFRALVAADIPTLATSKISGLAASATTDTTNASNITSGTLLTAQGGTGVGLWSTGLVKAISGSSSLSIAGANIDYLTASNPGYTGVLTTPNQSANVVWSGPTSGAAASATFRGLVAADIPTISVSQVSGVAGVYAPLASPTFTGIVSLVGSSATTIRGYVSYQQSDDINGARFIGAKSRLTGGFPSHVLAGDAIVHFGGVSYHDTAEVGWSSSIGSLVFYAAENHTDISSGTYASISVTPIGAYAPIEAIRVDPAGRVGIGRVPTTYQLEAQGDIFTTGTFHGSGSALTGITKSQVSGAAASGANADITSLTGITGAISSVTNPASVWGFDFNGTNTGAIANNGTFTFAAGAGLIILRDASNTGNMALFMVGGSLSTLVAQGGTIFANTVTAGKISITYAGSNQYVLTNKSGFTVTFRVGLARIDSVGS